jgi:thiamine pyrophosphate-dependent acetolactate synthase large subunit-like protein
VSERYYTTSSAFLGALAEAGIACIFANLGSDHPGIIEALAQAKAEGRDGELPTLIICPHETVALSAAHAYAMVTGEPQALTAEVTAEIATALASARRPLIVTSYLGRDPSAVASLVALAELLAIPVVEAMAYHVNFPDDHPLHAGFQYHSVGQNPVLAEADVILVLDSDVPWIPSVNRPSDDAAVYCVDIDPLKSQTQLWDVPARRFAAADSKVAVEQIAAFVQHNDLLERGQIEERRPSSRGTA